jgi:two-component system sensor histidine kinase KdpD
MTVALIGATTLGLNLARSFLNTPVVALLYLLPVVASTALWGLTAGVVASVSAFLAFNFFFLPPYLTLVVHQTQDFLALVVFLAVAILISQLVGRAQANLAIAQAREREATHLYELSLAILGLRNEEAIAQAVVDRLREVFQTRGLELALHRRPPAAALTFGEPPAVSPTLTPPSLVLPLTTARGPLGEIRLWRDRPLDDPSEARLLRTFLGQAALALEHAQLSLAETRAQVLAESDRLKSALLSSVSHELRTPLATITAAVTSLRSREFDWTTPERDELLAAIEEEAEHLNQVVGNLLDMSRIEAGSMQPHRQWNSLTEILGGTLERMRRATDRHRVQIEIPENLPLVPVDAVLLDQVFTNLISNSVKYAPAGTTINITARQESAEPIQVQVSNEGPPVPETDLDHIFDKFYRITAADRVTGVGLGLSICRGIVEAHGGRIWARNLAQGFAFHFTLPLTWDGAAPRRLPVERDLP